MTGVKFAACPCSADAEAWELLDRTTTTDADRATGVSVVTYECQTCGTTRSTTTDVTVV